MRLLDRKSPGEVEEYKAERWRYMGRTHALLNRLGWYWKRMTQDFQLPLRKQPPLKPMAINDLVIYHRLHDVKHKLHDYILKIEERQKYPSPDDKPLPKGIETKKDREKLKDWLGGCRARTKCKSTCTCSTILSQYVITTDDQ